MKVVILSLLSGHIERGVEVWAEALKTSLSGQCDIHILNKENYRLQKLEKDHHTLAHLFFLDHWGRTVTGWTLSSLWQIHKLNPDVVIPTNGGWQSIIIRIYTLLTRKRMIIVGHSGMGRDDWWNVLSFPNVFVALSTSAAAWAKRKNRFIAVEYIPNGIFLEHFSKKKSRLNLSLEKPIYICVGAFESGKRQAYAIDAVSKLQKGSLLLLGSGPLKKQLSQMGNEILGTRFKMLSVPHSKISQYYHAADVFTLPAWKNEAFGIVFLEAMASGLPVVTSDDPVKKEIVGNAGVFINPEDPTNYAQALEYAARKKWRNIPLKQAEKYSWKIVSQKYLQLFYNK